MKTFQKISSALALLIFSGIIFSCRKSSAVKNAKADSSEQISIVATIFPEYDWLLNILGNHAADKNISLKLLVQNGADLHSFQPSAADIISISRANLFIYVGGESDAWVGDVLKNSANQKRIVLNLMDLLGDSIKQEEIVEGMQAEEADADEENDIGGNGDGHRHDEVEYDEHIWLSLNNAQKVCEKIAGALSLLLPENAADFSANLISYTQRLKELDAAYSQAAAASKFRTVVFCDRFPFRYLTDDYGIKYFAAFTGCSAETEASFETVAFLAKKISALNLGNVFVIENSDKKLAATVLENSENKNCAIVVLDSMQSTTMQEIRNGENYIGVMTDNLEKLRKAL